MKKILALAGSNNTLSINHKLIEYTASLITELEVKVLDIRHWKVPMYSLDIDGDDAPAEIAELIKFIKEYDGFIISSPEHNGATPAFLKNILDWLSRKANKVFDNKPLLLMSTSPGAGGGANNLKYLINALPYQGATIGASFSLPSFSTNFQDGCLADEFNDKLLGSINEFLATVNS